MKSIFEPPDFEAYLARLEAAGRNVDEAAGRAVDAGADVALAGMRRRVRKDTFALEKHLAKSELEHDGNRVFLHVGLLDLGPAGARYGKQRVKKSKGRRSRGGNAYPRQFLYGSVQEFGSSSMKAQPYIRPTFDGDRKKIYDAERESLKADGVI